MRSILLKLPDKGQGTRDKVQGTRDKGYKVGLFSLVVGFQSKHVRAFLCEGKKQCEKKKIFDKGETGGMKINLQA